jgi:LmbE family N-acetylglucosaminyl deacetylase
MTDGRSCTVLHLAPHPDDEAIGAAATLLALRDKGHRVINLACSLGSKDEERRLREVTEACRRADFELVVHEPPLRISRGDDRQRAQVQLAATVCNLVEREGVNVIVAPSPHDGHHGHEVVGRAARDAVGGSAVRLWLWGLWADLPWPTLYFGFDEPRLAQAIEVLNAHEEEVARNDYRAVVRGRAAANRSLGSERVFGFGAGMLGLPYAELLMEVLLRDGEWWTGGARQLEPEDPLAEARAQGIWRARPIGWWLHAASFGDQVGRSIGAGQRADAPVAMGDG